MVMLGVIVVVVSTFLIFLPWFSLEGSLSSGDWPYLFVENIREFSFFPENRFFWLGPYYQIPTKILVQYLGIPWEATERILWFFPFLILSIVSSYKLTKSWIGVLIYTTNTYILMLVGGGQMGVAMAYSVAPFVLGNFIKLIDGFRNVILRLKAEESHKILRSAQDDSVGQAVWAGSILAVQTMFDPRIGYITLIAIFLYWLFNLFADKTYLFSFFKSLVGIFAISIAITLTINSFWIVPFFLGKISLEIESFGSLAGFKFFSFANFPHAFSLLHPNWPENIFGKTYFLRPEFLVLPILAYASLLFLKNSKSKITNSKQIQNSKLQIQNNSTMKQLNPVKSRSNRDNGAGNKTILFFAFLGLMGAFLAKGTNEPFGFINSFLFEHIPGFTMFRDPTKFYMLITVSYSMLVPYSISRIYEWLKQHSEFSIFIHSASSGQFSIKSKIFNLQNLFLLFAICYLLFLIRPALVGELSGTFKPSAVPKEYIRLKDFFAQKDYTKTLWIPQRQRFGFVSKKHLSFDAVDLFKTSTPSAIVSQIRKKQGFELTQSLGIEYIVVPFDVKGELFLSDRRYDAKKYEEAINAIIAIKWLKRIDNFEKIGVFYVVKK